MKFGDKMSNEKTIDQIRQEWLEDCKINPVDSQNELLRIPTLHAKYLNYLSECRMEVKSLGFKMVQLEKEKREYYSGLMPKEKLEQKGWRQFRLKITKGELPVFIESDDDVIKLQKRIEYYSEIVDFCDSILKELGNRTWQIREYLTHERYMNGAR